MLLLLLLLLLHVNLHADLPNFSPGKICWL
jgi:hypothetical protein